MLAIHVSARHPPNAHTAATHEVRPNPAPVARPEIDLGATEEDWKFFTDEFTRYKRTMGITGQTVLDELWHCTSKQLRALLQSEDTTSLTTETLLTSRMKGLAVTMLHSVVHLVHL